MSGESLRAALERRLETLPKLGYENGYPVQALPKAELLGLLAAHPAEPAPDRQPSDAAVEAAAKASYEVLASVWRWLDLSDSEKNMRRQRARAALVAAYRVDAPRPLLDREATTRAIEAASSRNDHIIGRTYVEAYADVFADAVMELARPMPTREQIATAIDPVAFDAHKSDESYDNRRKLALSDAAAVLALLNGADQ